MARGGTRSRADGVLAAALAAGMTHEQAAQAAGVSVRTVARRVGDPAFRRRIDAEQDAIIERFTGATVAGLEKALERLGELTGSSRELVALGASRCLLEFAIRLREHGTLTRRLGALEAAADGEHPGETGSAGAAGGGPEGEPAGGGDPDEDQGGPGGGADPGGDAP